MDCGSWTTWDKQPEDRCISCNSILDPVALLEKMIQTEKEIGHKENDFLQIRETDGVAMRSVRRVAWFFHLLFATIMWVFLWMVTTFSG